MKNLLRRGRGNADAPASAPEDGLGGAFLIEKTELTQKALQPTPPFGAGKKYMTAMHISFLIAEMPTVIA